MNTIVIFAAIILIDISSEIGLPEEHRLKRFSKYWWLKFFMTFIGMCLLVLGGKI